MEYDPYNARNPSQSRKGKTTVSLATSDGEVLLPPTDIEDVKAALDTMKGRVPEKARKAAARKATKPNKTGHVAMFAPEETGEAIVNGVAAGQLRAFVERVERLEEERATIGEDIKEVYAEAKGHGFDVKAIRTIVRLRKKDQAERQEEEAMVDLYKAALGMA